MRSAPLLFAAAPLSPFVVSPSISATATWNGRNVGKKVDARPMPQSTIDFVAPNRTHTALQTPQPNAHLK